MKNKKDKNCKSKNSKDLIRENLREFKEKNPKNWDLPPGFDPDDENKDLYLISRPK